MLWRSCYPASSQTSTLLAQQMRYWPEPVYDGSRSFPHQGLPPALACTLAQHHQTCCPCDACGCLLHNCCSMYSCLQIAACTHSYLSWQGTERCIVTAWEVHTTPCTGCSAPPGSHWQQACSQEEIEKGFLRRAMTLCQDTDYIVRINMCDGLHRLAAAVGLEVTVSTILPEILELMKDEEALVRVSATNSLVAGAHSTLSKLACMCYCSLHLPCQTMMLCMMCSCKHIQGAKPHLPPL